ncbi:MAG: hypothetical protein NTW86_29285 [Candidatus Sumerlaeota bacterium]|nr:hypothetical protein [Candidatus Sumerlaeota bacterium]
MNQQAHIETSDLGLILHDGGLFSVRTKSADREWAPDPWEGIPCRVTYEIADGARRAVACGGLGRCSARTRDGGSVDLVLRSPDGAVSVETRLSLDRNILHVALRRVDLPADSRLVSVEYPFRSFHLHSDKDDGYLALASGEGCLIPTHPVKLGTTAFFTWEDVARRDLSHIVETNPSAPFYGARKNGAGYVAILETTDDFAFQYLLNSDVQDQFDTRGLQSPYERIACAWPVWLAQKGALGYERRMRFEFAAPLDYVSMCKAYRKEAIAAGHFVSLADKERERPQIARLAGAPYIAYYAGYPHRAPGYPGFEYTYKQLQAAIDDLAGPMGLRRAFVHFWGAYAAQPPDCLPFDTAPGPVGDLGAAVAASKRHGFLFTLYNDISAQLEETRRWRPELQWKTADGRTRASFRWSRTCSSQYVRLLARHMPEVVRTLGLEACYVDCINSGRMNECYDPAHPLTRTQDREARTAFYQYVHSLRLIFGGEHVGWWNAAELEYTNGCGAFAGSHLLLRQFSVPLMQLVFHDALILFCHAGDDYTTANGASFEDKVLRDLLRGIPPVFFLNLRDHARWRKKIMDSYTVMSDPAAAVMRDEMVSHEWLTDDRMVQRTVFSSGVEIRANFDETEREELPAKGYEAKGLPGGPRRGGFASHWETACE